MYKSRLTGNECGFAQYLAELMCIRKAKLQGLVLKPGFWNTDTWRKIYRLQIIKANALKNAFSEEAIIASLFTKNGERIWSLYWKDLSSLIFIEEDRLVTQKEKLKNSEKTVTKEDIEHYQSTEPTKQFIKKTELEKLRELDG